MRFLFVVFQELEAKFEKEKTRLQQEKDKFEKELQEVKTDLTNKLNKAEFEVGFPSFGITCILSSS